MEASPGKFSTVASVPRTMIVLAVDVYLTEVLLVIQKTSGTLVVIMPLRTNLTFVKEAVIRTHNANKVYGAILTEEKLKILTVVRMAMYQDADRQAISTVI